MIIGGGILVHPPPEKQGQRQTKMVCLCGIATQKNLLSEFEILGTVKLKPALVVVFNTTKGPDRLFVPIVTVFVPIVTKYT